MRARLVAYARSRAGCVLGVTAIPALVAISDRLLGVPPGVLPRTTIWHNRSR